jgi:predicted regulator of Ras-like GTPase activity (Roadblock/LC7/MglB family)
VAHERRELERLNRLPGTRGALLAGRDGILVEATLERNRAEALSALVAAAFGSAAGLGESLPALADPEELLVESDGGTLHVVPSGASHLLAVLASTAGNLGVIRLEMRQAATRLAAEGRG